MQVNCTEPSLSARVPWLWPTFVHSGSLIVNGREPKSCLVCSTLSLAVLLLFIHIRLCLELKTLPKVLSRYPKVVHGEFLKAKMDYKIVIIILGYSSLEKQRNKNCKIFSVPTTGKGHTSVSLVPPPLDFFRHSRSTKSFTSTRLDQPQIYNL